MLRPLFTDLFLCIMPFLAGCVLFLLGRRSRSWSRFVRLSLVAISLVLVATWAVALAGIVPLDIRPFFYWLGGGMVVLCCAALFLLGMTFRAPGNSFSPAFLLFLAGFAELLILIESSAPLSWRWFASAEWQNRPDSRGRLRQSTGKTCGPAAAVMLLDQAGIQASEGEIAYLAGTSWFGTDGYALARAVQQKLLDSIWHTQRCWPTYDQLSQIQRGFIAQVHRPGIGNHAIFVVHAHPDVVDTIDPLTGERTPLSRDEFLEQWNGEIITIVPRDNG